jgi:Tol biopolymer transport system component
MTSTQATTTKTKHYYLRGLAVLVALTVAAGTLAEQARPAHATFPGDNGKVAFESNRSGSAEIYTMKPKPEGSKNRPKNLTNTAASDTQPAVSPDGKKIAFTSNRDGNYDIYVMNSKDGSKQKNCTNNGNRDEASDWEVASFS